MNKKELIEAVAESSQLARAESERAVEAVLAVVAGELARGEAVTLPGFGTFEVRHRAARKGRNPQTGAEIDIAASSVPAFKAASALKKRVAG